MTKPNNYSNTINVHRITNAIYTINCGRSDIEIWKRSQHLLQSSPQLRWRIMDRCNVFITINKQVYNHNKRHNYWSTTNCYNIGNIASYTIFTWPTNYTRIKHMIKTIDAIPNMHLLCFLIRDFKDGIQSTRRGDC